MDQAECFRASRISGKEPNSVKNPVSISDPQKEGVSYACWQKPFFFLKSEVLRRFPAVFDPLKCISSSFQNDGLQTPMLVCTLETFS